MADKNIYDFPSGENVGAFFKRFGKMFVALIVLIVVAVLALNSFYTIKEQEKAVVTTFGKAQAVSDAGLHFKIPFIQMVQKVNTTIQGLSIGYDINTNARIETESMMITEDYNFVNVDFFVEYKVSDPVKALYASDDPVTILKSIAQSSIRNVVGSSKVDDVITTGKNEIQAAIKETILAKLEQQDIGIQLINITIQDAEPPTDEVMQAFKSVETAKQGADTAKNNADKYQNEQLPKADAQVDQILQQAETAKAQRINQANAEVAKFNKMYDEYIKNPTITKKRMFYEAMENILPNLKVIIDDGSGGTQKLLPLDTLMQGGAQ